ncbi:MAG: PEP-CTERM sorting domain-containing protein [Bryobacteraceae bacterium]
MTVGILSDRQDPNEGLIFLENVLAPGAEDLTSSTELNVVVPEPATPWLLSAFGVVALLARKWNDPD